MIVEYSLQQLFFLQQNYIWQHCSSVRQHYKLRTTIMEPCSSISDQTQPTIELPICDTSSRKRASLESDDTKQEKRKRRSSLSYHRRSITGLIPSSVLSDAQPTSNVDSKANSLEAQTADPQPCSSQLPNSDHSQMDAVIADMKAQIQRLEYEHEIWEDLFSEIEEEEKQSKKLSMNLTLPVNDIPEDIKESAIANYIGKKPLDLVAMKSQLDAMLLQLQCDRESCIKDVKLVQYVVQTMQFQNTMMASELSHAFDQDVKEISDGVVGQDTKDVLERFLTD
ncbi:hypothetical protein Btru_057803 [Bulinus truncatus]|nr:hypothetical protein Btru_057803 [Bulinus truncatus]